MPVLVVVVGVAVITLVQNRRAAKRLVPIPVKNTRR